MGIGRVESRIEMVRMDLARIRALATRIRDWMIGGGTGEEDIDIEKFGSRNGEGNEEDWGIGI